MTRHFFMLLSLLPMLGALTACDAVERSARRAGHNVHMAYDSTRYKLSDMMFTRDEQPPHAGALVHDGYCYQLNTDVLCYPSAQPHLAHRLVGAQQYGAYVAAPGARHYPMPLPANVPPVYQEKTYQRIEPYGQVTSQELSPPASPYSGKRNDHVNRQSNAALPTPLMPGL